MATTLWLMGATTKLQSQNGKMNKEHQSSSGF
jgi:hypothetical protein